MTDMDSLTELMAKAIFANDLAWHGMLEKNRERFRNQARACLTALSEAGWVVVETDLVQRVIKHAEDGQSFLAINYNHTDAHEKQSEQSFEEIERLSAMVAAGRGEI